MHFLVFDKKFRGGIFCKFKKKLCQKFRNSGPEFRLLVIAIVFDGCNIYNTRFRVLVTINGEEKVGTNSG
jgi:hypothetical protein